jgi:hypothetical protein
MQRGTGSLVFADLRWLRRDILPNGITTGAEIVSGRDHTDCLDGEWSAYLAEAVATFVASASEPPSIDQDTAAWLVAVLSTARPTTAAAIVRNLEREGSELSGDVAAFVRRVGRRPAIPA